jgi:predicted anti-sigma-YlaC factor YlaD
VETGNVPSCRDITELITDYLEGKLSFLAQVRFQLHLGTCRHCRAYLRQMRATIRASGRLHEVPMPPEVESELLRRFRTFQR